MIPNTHDAFSRLEPVLRSLIEEHQQLLSLVDRHHTAIRQSDRDAIGQSLMDQSDVLQRIAELDRARMSIVHDLKGRLGLRGDLTVTELIRHAEEPLRARLKELAMTLRDTIEHVRKRNNVIRQASVTLLAHMEGLMNQVQLKLSHTRTYSPRGAMGRTPQVVSGLDLTR